MSDDEKAMELEALEAIYPSELEKIDDDNIQITLTASVDSSNTEDEELSSVILKVKFTGDYPSEAPILAIEPVSEVTKEQTDKLMVELKSKVEELLGMQMIYSLCQTVQEWLDQSWQDSIEKKKKRVRTGGIKKNRTFRKYRKRS
eukprot:TRINITY_DN1578_c0_g1_i1.p1 TRINITY_DN1578_c0_g1~~TRINITY_DN1578_c0_g1_i1.p1  ORF type:complete len:167 (-),score=36.74 TRINITY_DN1578_c0_g1_i1:358-792(-)